MAHIWALEPRGGGGSESGKGSGRAETGGGARGGEARGQSGMRIRAQAEVSSRDEGSCCGAQRERGSVGEKGWATTAVSIECWAAIAPAPRRSNSLCFIFPWIMNPRPSGVLHRQDRPITLHTGCHRCRRECYLRFRNSASRPRASPRATPLSLLILLNQRSHPMRINARLDTRE